jgi:alkanesulfonate monooxygenase SsuD/methylene tetrahydromethanopterin reductase-like flavin-dependent oxidoreductase (luciferase family)
MERTMKFSMFLMGTKTARYTDIIDQVCEAEYLGFDGAWLAERYFASADLLCPSPMVLASFLAARTSRLRLGLAARVLPFHHPLHVAADTAILDTLSGGRFDLGLSRGSMDEAPHAAFGVPREEARVRFDEAFEVLLRAFEGRTFSYHGRYYHLDEVTPRPTCTQWPHPPLYMVANHPLSLDDAATRGLSIFLHGAQRIEELTQSLARYRERSLAAGHQPEDIDIPVNRFVFVGRTSAHAHHVIREPFLQFLNERAPDLKAYLVNKFGPLGLDYEFLTREICLFGDSDQVADRLHELQERLDLRHVLCTLNFITLDQKDCVESMRRFATDVIPRFQTAARTAGTPEYRPPVRSRPSSAPLTIQ